MTREEAIEIINRENDPNDTKVWGIFPKYREALEMAIQALSQESCEKCVYSTKDGYCQYDDVIETIPPLEPCDDIAQERYKDLCEYFGGAKDILKNREDFKAWLGRVKWHIRKAEELYEKYEYKGEPCDDAVSRQAVLDLATTIQTDDYSGNEILEVIDVDDVKDLPLVTQKPIECTDAVSRGVFEQVMWERDIAIEQLHELGYELGQKIEPCEDAISRYDTINMMHIIMDGAYIGDNDEDSNCYESLNDIKEQYIEIVKGANSITPSSRKGHWEKINMQMFGIDYECSECKRREQKKSDFCPNCGAEMESGE